ncbi:MAG TPA: hypothetical protein VF115_01100 [Acidimicrobiia bacterium]
MSRPDDYSDEMFTKHLSDDNVEAVLSGRALDDPVLAEIARALGALEPERFADPTGENAAAFAKRAASVARAGEPVGFAATARFRRGLSLTPRLAPAAVAAILLFAMTGVAVASDSSVPGDALYGIDRALENIGIGDGGAAERLEEASTLTENGDSAAALDLLAETFDPQSSQAADALLRASERVRQGGGGNSDVAEMLQWMSEMDFRGREFAEDVVDHANDLGGEDQSTETEDRNQSGEAPGPNTENPGQGGENQGQEDQGQGNQNQGGQGQGRSGSAPGQSKP